MNRLRSPLRWAGAHGWGRSLGSVFSHVLHRRTCIGRSAPRLHSSGHPGADPRLKKTVECMKDQDGFQQWLETCRAIVWLPTGIPTKCRQQIWVTLADHYLQSISIDWAKTKHLLLDDLRSLDEDALGMQVEKDLLQSSLNLDVDTDVESFHAALKRLLLAYAHWNTQTGYCQGFIIPAAVILTVMGSDEEDALKVLVYLLDRVLPHNYFANSISALTVDVTIFHELLKIQLPELSQHLEQLCRAAKQAGDGRCVLPLHTVVSMHWFLTLFTSCLPKESVLRIFDAIFFVGSEVLLCVALAIWAQLEEWIKQCQSMDEVSQQFGREMRERNLTDPGELMQAVYAMTTLPFPKVKELREKFSPTSSQTKFTDSSGRLNESSVRRNPSSETNGHCTFLAAVGYSQAQNPRNRHTTGQTPRSGCDVTGAAAGENVPERDAVRSRREQPVAKQRPCKVPEQQQQSQHVTPKHGSTDTRAPGTPLHSHKTKGISRFLGGQTLKKSRKSKSSLVPHNASPSAALPGQKGEKNRLTLGWYSQKVSRKGLGGNKKAKSDCSDTVSLLEDQTDCGKAESPRVDDSIHVVMEKSRKMTGICWERIGKYGKQLTGSLLERDVDNLAGVGNLFKALQIVERRQYSPAQNHSPLESSTGQETKDFTAPSHPKENPANALLPRYLSGKSLTFKRLLDRYMELRNIEGYNTDFVMKAS